MKYKIENSGKSTKFNLKFAKPMKKKKQSKTTLKNKADKLFSLFVRSLDHCEKCGSVNNLQAAHVYSRRYVNLRYDIYNVLCLCAKCHLEWHHSPLEALMWFNQAYKDRVQYLLEKKQEIKRWTVADY